MNNIEPCGVICINKPQDFTSFDIVAIARKAAGTRKIGHGGTLDPMATGVLPLFIGRAAKTADLVPQKNKQYRAGFRLGVISDTEDVWGNVSEQSCKAITREELEDTVKNFCGEIYQIPPMYSAVKVNGRRLYDIARGGGVIERSARKITVYGITLLSYDEKQRSGELLIDCSKGTYIRTLIADMGKSLGVGGIMTALVRTKSAGFTLSDCITPDVLRMLSPSELKARLIPTERLFDGCRTETLDSRQKRLFLNGTMPNALCEKLSGGTGNLVKIKDADGNFLGLVRADENDIKPVYLEITV